MSRRYIFWIGLALLSADLFSQDFQSQSQTPATLSKAQEVYTIVYFSESSRLIRITVTHPDGKTERKDHSLRLKERHLMGDFALLMPVLNELASSGFAIKSHTMTFENDEGTEHRHHVFVLVKMVR